jgi:alcohol dehydrogenase (cytochrome c)
VKGRVYALNASTGQTVWEFHAIPDSGPARETWEKASAQNLPSGGATWTSYAVDPEAAPDFAAELHPGDNLYSNSVLALDAKTGRLIDFVQPVKNDFHDWDVSAGPALISTKSGKSLIAAGAKDGQLYGIDRAGIGTAASSNAEQPTAPRTLKVVYQTVVTTRENVDARLNSERETRFCPGSQGGVEWNGPSYSRDLNLVFVNAIDWCTSVRLGNVATMSGKPGMAWTGSADPKLPFGRMDPEGRWQGWLTAVDADTGQVRWKYRSAKPLVAAVTATAGGLVFTGDLDGEVRAFDGADGRELWHSATGKAIGGGVISYEAKGKQHIAVAAGLNSPIWPIKGGPARVVVYALP